MIGVSDDGIVGEAFSKWLGLLKDGLATVGCETTTWELIQGLLVISRTYGRKPEKVELVIGGNKLLTINEFFFALEMCWALRFSLM